MANRPSQTRPRPICDDRRRRQRATQGGGLVGGVAPDELRRARASRFGGRRDMISVMTWPI